ARIALPSLPQVHESLRRFRLHPSLLDAALQASSALEGSSRQGMLSLPFALGALEELAPCASSMWAIVRRGAGSAAGDALQKLDIDLCDDGGAVCVRFKELSMRSVRDSG